MLLILTAITVSLTAAVDPTPFTYKTIGNLSIEALVYLPVAVNPSPKYPVIMAIHGGGYIAGVDLSPYPDQVIKDITSRGWCIVSIDYRLSPGVLLQDIIEDVTDAYNWIRNDLSNNVPLNPDMIVVWGNSAGGALALIAGYTLTPRPQSVVSFYPYYANFTDPSVYDSTETVSDTLISLANSLREPLTKFISVEDEDGSNNTRLQLFFQARGENKTGWLLTTTNPNESPENITAMLKEYSVVYNIDKDYPPTYIVHGMLDNLTPYTQSIQVADQLEKYNISHKLILVPDAGHGFGRLFATQWSQNMEPLLEFIEVRIPPLTTKPNVLLTIVLIIVLVVAITLSTYLYKKVKLRQKKKSDKLIKIASPESASANAKDSPTNTVNYESLSHQDEQVILELPQQAGLEADENNQYIL